MSGHKNDGFWRILLTFPWLICLLIFYVQYDKPAFVIDLWGNSKIENSDGKNIYFKNNLDIVVLTKSNSTRVSEYFISDSRAPVKDSLSKDLNKKVEIFEDSNDDIRFMVKKDLVDKKVFSFIWYLTRIMLIIVFLSTTIFLFYFWIFPNLHDKHQVLYTRISDIIVSAIALIHGFFIFLFGGLLVSPFGIIATTVLTSVISNDTIKYSRTNSLRSFTMTFIYLIATIISQIFYLKYRVDSHYELLVGKFNETNDLNWSYFMTLVSLCLGFLITKRVVLPENKENL